MSKKIPNKSYKTIATEIRCTVLGMVHRAKASHVGSALSIVDMLAVIFNHDGYNFVNNNELDSRDSFILSKGHACTALYATLFNKGLLSQEMIEAYGMNDSPLMHHISHKVPFVDFSSGSLGHGLPVTIGLAKADQINHVHYNRVCVVGDGELAEGSNWEALLFAAHHKLGNVTLIIDHNNLQSLNTVEDTLNLYPIADKMSAFGCHVLEIDGHNHEDIKSALMLPTASKPKVIIMNTTKGKGVSFMENSVRWHYKNPDDTELSLALAELKYGGSIDA
jgi:transketolase